MFRVTREMEFGDLKVVVKELTVAEIRAWLNEPAPVEPRAFDLFTDLLVFDGIGVEEIVRFTDLQRGIIEDLPPSAMAKIAAVIKEINGVFFNQYLPSLNKLRERLVEDSKTLADSNAA